MICLLFCFIACDLPDSEEGRREYDPDLSGWRSASWSPFGMGDRITGFAYGDGCYVAISENGKIAWSDDGDIWIRADAPDGLSLASVCYGNGKFVAAGSGGIYVSGDGKKWEPANYGGAGFLNGVAYGADRFVAVGVNSISWSTDGVDWTAVSPTPFYILNDVTFDAYENRFYTVGDGGNRGWANASNPAAWNFHSSSPPIDSADIKKVAAGRYGNGTGIGFLYGSPARFAVALHRDFTYNNDFIDTDVVQFLFSDYGYAMNGIAWGPPSGDVSGNFVVAGACAMIGYWPSAKPSNVGERFFRAISFPEFKRWEISALEACNGRFFIGNVDGKIGYSK